MNFSEEIINVLDYLGNKMGIAIDWTSSNVLPYIEQLCAKYITWEIATSIVWIVLGTLLLLLCPIFIKLGRYAKKKYEKLRYSSWDELEIFFYVCAAFCVILSLPCIITQIFDITKCVCFPEMQIYEYITSLMSNGN